MENRFRGLNGVFPNIFHTYSSVSTYVHSTAVHNTAQRPIKIRVLHVFPSLPPIREILLMATLYINLVIFLFALTHSLFL